MAFGGELAYAAFGFGAGSFSLAGIRLEEILGVWFQALEMDAVILRFCLLIVGISRFRCLAQVFRVCSIVDNAAAPGIRSPGDDRPSRSGAFDAWPVSDLYCLCFRLMLWCRRCKSGQSRC